MCMECKVMVSSWAALLAPWLIVTHSSVTIKFVCNGVQKSIASQGDLKYCPAVELPSKKTRKGGNGKKLFLFKYFHQKKICLAARREWKDIKLNFLHKKQRQTLGVLLFSSHNVSEETIKSSYLNELRIRNICSMHFQCNQN